MRSSLLFFYSIGTFDPLWAQEELHLPDTLFFQEARDETVVISLEGVGTVRQEVPDLHASVVEVAGPWYGSRYLLAVRDRHGCQLLPIIGDDAVQDIEVQAMDVLENGHQQEVVLTMSYLGHTGWEHSIHERDRQLRVRDMHTRRCVLDLTIGYSREEWTNSSTPDSTGLLSFEEREMLASEGDASCVAYEPSFLPGVLTLLRTDECGLQDGGLDLPSTAGHRVVYRLQQDRWVKQ